MVGTKNIVKPTQNPWRLWLDDTEETREITFISDTASGCFPAESYIKDPSQLSEVHKYLKDNFKLIQNFYKETLCKSLKFPRIDFDTIQQTMKAF